MLHCELLRPSRKDRFAPIAEIHYFDSANWLVRLQKQGYSRAEMARLTGLTIPQLTQRLHLLELDEGLRGFLRTQEVPERIALLLLRLPDALSRRRMAHRIVQERLCVRDAALLVQSARRRLPKEAAVTQQRVVTVVRDVRLYRNAIRDIAEQMKTAGVRATFTERRTGGMQELTVAYPARRRRTERYQSM